KGGADAGNYVFASPQGTTTADITAKNLTISGASANDKVYDGNNTATVNWTNAQLQGVVGTESVGYSTANDAASFGNKNVGTGKTVSVSGISISGADAGNYNLLNSTASTTANITQKPITGSFTAANKVYDGTNAATVLSRSLMGAIAGDDVSLSGGIAT